MTTGGADPAEPLPLVIVLHGRGESTDKWVERLADLDVPARIVLPTGPLSLGRGRRAWFRPLAREQDEPRFAKAVANASARVARFAESIADQVPTCGRPLVVGYSQGGIVALTLALHHADAIDEAVAIAGTIPADLLPSSYGPHAPLRDLHGTGDARVEYQRASDKLQSLGALGFDVQLASYPGTKHRVTRQIRDDVLDAVQAHARRVAQRCR